MTSLILTLLFVIIVAISALVGFIRGLNKSVIRLITLVPAVIVTLLAAAPLTSLIAQSIVIGGKTLGEMLFETLKSEAMIADILESAVLMQEAVLVAPAFAMAIVIFPIVFLLLNFISWLIFICIQKPIRKFIFKENFDKKDTDKPRKGARLGKKFAGMGIGVVAGVLAFGMVLVPVFGLVGVMPEQSEAYEVIDALAEQGVITADEADIIKDEYLVADGAIVKFYGLIGATPAGKAYLDSVSEISANGQTTYITDELDSLLAVAQTAIEGGLLKALVDSENTYALYEALADEEFVNNLVLAMFDSNLLRSAVPEIMAIAMESVAKSLSVPAETVGSVKESVRETVKVALDDPTKSEETAATLAVVISNFTGAISAAIDENGNIDATKLDFNKVADAIMALQDSALKGVGSAILDIVAAGDLGKNNMLGNAIDAIKDGYESGNKEIGGAIGSAGALVGLVGSTGGEGAENNKEAAAESIKVLTENLNDFTVQLLPDILTSEALEDMGVPTEKTDATYDVFETLFDELLDLKKSGAESYDNEVNATLSIYTIATSGKNNFSTEEVSELIDCAEKSTAIANTIKSVSETDSNPFGITISDEGKRAEIVKVIEDNYKENTEDRELYRSVAKLLGLEDYVKFN